ncbi:transcription/translation regulatory transformer protein RfaH [Pseudomonas sp. SG20052]|uniref:transcription/translation regulatory transformer protein RfaH n=1 Tax=Pseudomonas sp. SG20052 TaxID=3074147 RepID=UPI00287F5ED3|nr:transcription/translation regulatory transformer protein RfaH [Pseudomonas sp. SG20052]WNF53334.1 transcription/translation regulatory transformer protein RfaH [Pseudomonas sp. SG20052]
MPAIRSERSNWYLLQCKPHQDERAHLNLLQQNYVVFHPQLLSERLIRGKYQRVRESLFPGYLFIHLGGNDNWAPIRSTRGVSRFVELNHGPATVAENVIEHLRARCFESSVSPDTPPLTPGDHLQIIRGPLSTLEGIFITSHGAERVMILMQFLNRDQAICMPLSDLELQHPSFQSNI